MARATTVPKSRKDQGKCSRCEAPLPAGTGYVYWKPFFRSNYKIVRCLKGACAPRPSELDNSKTSAILAAQEAYEDNKPYESADDLQEAVEAVAEAVRDVAQEYGDAADAWEHGNERLEELRDHYEEQASNLEGFSASDTWEEYEADDEEERPEPADDADEEAQDEYAEWKERREAVESTWDDARNEADEAVNGVEFL